MAIKRKKTYTLNAIYIFVNTTNNSINTKNS